MTELRYLLVRESRDRFLATGSDTFSGKTFCKIIRTDRSKITKMFIDRRKLYTVCAEKKFIPFLL